MRGTGLEVDVGPRQAEHFAHPEPDREQHRHHGSVPVAIGLGDQATDFLGGQHLSG